MQTDGTLLVPDVPTVPYITGDGVGAEVTPAMQAVVDAAIRKESVADNRRFTNCWRTARFTYQKASVRPWVVTDGPTKLPSTWIRVYLKTSKELFHMTS